MEDKIIGSIISFKLGYWDEKGEYSTIDVKGIVKRIITDPLGRHETKYAVEYKIDEYLIHESEIQNIEYHQEELF